MAYLFLLLSIMSELLGTSMIKASAGFTKPLPAVGGIASFIVSLFFLSLSLKVIPLNMAYAIWSGAGTAATVLISVLLWKEKISVGSVLGIVLIIAGVVVLNFFGSGHGHAAETADNSTIVQ
ncbi:DMT family transporter [Indiicoccus explosivorum]|uniref:DMT family transporter n=1 Tax=Indiicoccus explosivorum TaxID=1917864 RepID=UPI000B42D0BA|nr:multidrug efflux SMR transporter [Indiicoccus explosivorum]